ncbi:hypothetical protein [Brevundimonas sp. P7753]|uniref:hypothetical protein n=1 Tax=Brevundimonas sp. P7753 TaxID=2726982 RepID=UPI0015B9C9B7|nr:hypothetical protein [Brevundimonas sp. P7753]NWE52934.1 hypothetical protein [Brevundimonas sp. P7753]
MPRTLDHLPAGKRDELAFVVELLTAGFDEKHADVLEFWGTAERQLLAELSSGVQYR